MYEEYFTEEHRILRESVRKFVEKEIRPHIDRWEDEELFPAEPVSYTHLTLPTIYSV